MSSPEVILSGAAQEEGHWVSSLRLSKALNLRSTIKMKPNSTIRSHKLLWLLSLTTPGFQNSPGAPEVCYIGTVTRMDNLFVEINQIYMD